METQNQPARIQLMLDMSSELYERIETAAEQSNTSIQEYIEKILEQNVCPYRPVSRESLEQLLQLREEIQRNHPGQSFEDSAEIIWQMREERSQHLTDL